MQNPGKARPQPRQKQQAFNPVVQGNLVLGLLPSLLTLAPNCTAATRFSSPPPTPPQPLASGARQVGCVCREKRPGTPTPGLTHTQILSSTFPGKASLLKLPSPQPTALLIPGQDLEQHLSGSRGPAAPSYSLRRRRQSQYLKGETNKDRKGVKGGWFQLDLDQSFANSSPTRPSTAVCLSIPRTRVQN